MRVEISSLVIANSSNQRHGITCWGHHCLRDELEPRVHTRVAAQVRVIVRQVTAKSSKIRFERCRYFEHLNARSDPHPPIEIFVCYMNVPLV